MSVRVHIEEEAAERVVKKRKEREEKRVKIRVTAYRVSFKNSIHTDESNQKFFFFFGLRKKMRTELLFLRFVDAPLDAMEGCERWVFGIGVGRRVSFACLAFYFFLCV